jgi:hypothetical protein
VVDIYQEPLVLSTYPKLHELLSSFSGGPVGYYAALLHRMLALSVGDLLLLIGSDPTRNGEAYEPLAENIDVGPCPVAVEPDDFYDGPGDAVTSLQCGHFKRPSSQSMGAAHKGIVPRQDLVYERPSFTKEV